MYKIRVKTAPLNTLYIMFCFILSSTFVVGLLLCIQITTAYLSINHLHIVQAIIKHPDSPEPIRKQAKQLLYKSYLPWVYKQTRVFVQSNQKHIQDMVEPVSLIQYAMSGYTKAIDRYNGSAPFHLYAEPYVRGSMYRGLTDLTVLKPFKHSSYRKYRAYQNTSKTSTHALVPYENYWTFDRLCSNNGHNMDVEDASRIDRIHWAVDELDSIHRRQFYLRYDYSTLTIKWTIDKICILLGISHETYRKRMNAILYHIKNRLPDYTK